MILFKFTRRAFKFKLKRVPPKGNSYNLMVKPCGMWISDEKSDFGWKDWCEGEQFNIDALKYKTRIIIDTKDVLVLDTPEKLIDFNQKWCSSQVSLYERFPKWKELKKIYKGIIISPYQWDFRLNHDFFWYYGWDCASGCIWDLSCVKKVFKSKKTQKRKINDIT